MISLDLATEPSLVSQGHGCVHPDQPSSSPHWGKIWCYFFIIKTHKKQ